ncbi:MAG: aryl-sulfate sulfotransferase [Candidatus Lernaella stagnicola]|nr:aryl-sulfate sulfotransferase [Candidatus Lernaella stagnicola]
MKKTMWLLAILLLPAVLLGAISCGDDDDDNGATDDDDDNDNDATGDDDDDNNDNDDDDNDTSFECSENNANWTVGLLLCQSGVSPGYTLFSPMLGFQTYLIDELGRVVNQWETNHTPGNSEYLLPDGNLLRTGKMLQNNFMAGGAGGILQLLSWDNEILWEFEHADASHLQHHDVAPLPNGNILVIAWEKKTESQAIAAGRDPARIREREIWSERVFEVEPTGTSGGNIVWEWRLWDHLVQDRDAGQANYGVVSEHPELIDINYPYDDSLADVFHLNTVYYVEEFDQIILSSRHFSEVWVIDHSTTTAEASGHSGGNSDKGGDLLYRWGNPEAYGMGDATRFFYGQHDSQRIEEGIPGAGNILVFNNGVGRSWERYSTVDEFTPPLQADGSYTRTAGEAFGPDELVWSYIAPEPGDLYSLNVSGVQRLPNGNTLVCSGNQGEIFEVTPDGQMVWIYINPATAFGVLDQYDQVPTTPGGNANSLFKTRRYAPGYSGFEGRDMTPGDYVEGGG